MQKRDFGYIIAISLLIATFLILTIYSIGIPTKSDIPFSSIPISAFSKNLILISLLVLYIGFPILSILGMLVAAYIGKKIAAVYQFAKFALVGVLNTAIDFGILNFLIFITGITSGLSIIPLNAVSFSTAVVNSFFWNKKLVFQARKDANFLTFFVITLIGLAINSGIVYVITTYVPPTFVDSQKLWANLAKVLATGISLVWNFTGYRLIVFKK